MPPPANSAALVGLPVAVLDLETTGLDVREVRVVQVGLVPMRGAIREAAPGLDLLVNPGIPIPAQATAIHGIGDTAVAGASDFAGIVEDLRAALAGRVAVGHHIAFDLAVLRFEAARAGVPWDEPPSLDVGMLLGALEPTLPDLSLEGVTRWLGVRIEGRHSALGDASACAEAFAALVPKLRAADVRTLGEAASFAARRQDIVLQQAQSGWHAVPGGARPLSRPADSPRLDTYVFERSLAEVMSTPPIRISPAASLQEAAQTMAARRIGALIVARGEGEPEGILTERDLLKVIARGDVDLRALTVAQAMSAPVQSMRSEEMLYRALGRMDRFGIRHLCITNERGAAIGVVSQRDLLQYRARGALQTGDAIASADDAAALATAFGHVPGIAQRLAAEGVGGVEVARVVSAELRAVTARAAEIAAASVQDTLGAAPASWCVMVLGSAGRGESLLSADQDNALIHAGSPASDAWFAGVGATLATLLDESGVPFCKGGVMASNDAWRGSGHEWATRLQGWLNRARPDDLLNIDIFFDLAPVAGDYGLATRLHEQAVKAAASSPVFLGLLATSMASLLPLVGHFGRLRVDAGRVDLKRCGLLPLVSLARALALRVGSGERSTPGRLRDAEAAGRVSPDDAAMLLELHGELMTLILRQQLADLDAGVRPSSRVPLTLLTRGRAKSLAAQLRRLEQLLQDVQGAMSS